MLTQTDSIHNKLIEYKVRAMWQRKEEVCPEPFEFFCYLFPTLSFWIFSDQNLKLFFSLLSLCYWTCAEEPKRTGFACMWLNHLSFVLPLHFLFLSLASYILSSPISVVKRFMRSANSLTSNWGNTEIVTHLTRSSSPCCLRGTFLRSQPQPCLAFPTLFYMGLFFIAIFTQ